jgi:hypothetical protein
MRAPYSSLMQSKFFNPAFNSAIFDGPVRIYFAQFHESAALKIYFCFQQRLAELSLRAKELHKHLGKNVLIMLYPNQESFEMSFEGQSQFLIQDNLDEDFIIGINGPFEDDQIDLILRSISSCVNEWEKDIEISPEALQI